MIDELHPDEIEAVLHRHHVGRLACVVAGEPYLVPITYTYRDGFIYGHTLPGQKLDAMRAEPRVSLAAVAGQASAAARKDTRLSQAERDRLAELYARRAMTLLQEAVQRGFRDVAAIQAEEGFHPLRQRKDFQEVLRGLQPVRPPG